MRVLSRIMINIVSLYRSSRIKYAWWYGRASRTR